jgi:hypothetical protein
VLLSRPQHWAYSKITLVRLIPERGNENLAGLPDRKALLLRKSMGGYLPMQYLHVYSKGAVINIEIVIDMTNDKRTNGKAIIPAALHLY